MILDFPLIKGDLSLDVGSTQRGESDSRYVSPAQLGSKESHDPPTLKLGRWLRVESLHSIVNEDKMSGQKCRDERKLMHPEVMQGSVLTVPLFS